VPDVASASVAAKHACGLSPKGQKTCYAADSRRSANCYYECDMLMAANGTRLSLCRCFWQAEYYSWATKARAAVAITLGFALCEQSVHHVASSCSRRTTCS